MPIIKSISGIRGTIGGNFGESLSPDDIVNFISAFSQQTKEKFSDFDKINIVLARDGRISGLSIYNLVKSVLILQGLNVLDINLASTPTLAFAVIKNKAQGGIMISASHNPRNWNALKFFNHYGQFISKKAGEDILIKANKKEYIYADVDNLGQEIKIKNALEDHIQAILKLPLIEPEKIVKSNFRVVIDGINSVGSLTVPCLVKALGVKNIKILNAEINGQFAHNPEPLVGNLTSLSKEVVNYGADIGLAVDPDVDRLAIIDEKGEYIGEEYSLIMVADYVFASYNKLGGEYNKVSVSNLSSSRALKDLSDKYKGKYQTALVGEVNVVEAMKETKAVIGGEGNGGIIYPYLHYSRDALVGIALILSYLSLKKEKVSIIRKNLPNYFIIKDKINLLKKDSLNEIVSLIKENSKQEKIEINEMDGIKIDWSDCWVHLRASNTEPIIRVYAEAKNLKVAKAKILQIKNIISSYIK